MLLDSWPRDAATTWAEPPCSTASVECIPCAVTWFSGFFERPSGSPARPLGRSQIRNASAAAPSRWVLVAEWNVQIVTASAAKDATIRMSKNERPVAGRSAADLQADIHRECEAILVDWARRVRDGAVQAGLERVQ